MSIQLPSELSAAIAQQGQSLEIVDPADQRVYFLVEGETYRQAMDALRRQQDHEAIAEGIAQMEAGETMSLDEARERTRRHVDSRQA